MTKRLLVVQPYIAEYRRDFYAGVREALADRDVELTIAVGQPDITQAKRGDAARLPNMIELQSRAFSGLGPTLRWQGSWRITRGFDAVVLEASGSLLDASIALMRRTPVGLWGHIDSFTRPSSRVDEWIERWQLRRSDAVLAYTPRGGTAALRYGVPPSRVHVLNNTIGTDQLIRRCREISVPQARQILNIDLPSDVQIFAFIGGLDSSKRLEFLAQALEELQRSAPELRLIVAGNGTDRHLLDAAAARGQVAFTGRAGVDEKAALAKVARGILMPGRVGLVAVDSLALGLPIITTNWSYHAPEFEYLRDGQDCVVVEDSVGVYVKAVERLLHDGRELDRLRQNALARAGEPSLQSMVDAFVAAAMELVSKT